MTASNNNLAYGADSTSYRGLTGPSQSALVLTAMLSAGMVATSPEIDVSTLLSNVDSLMNGILQDAASWSSMVDRLSFEWEMSSLPSSFQQWSDQLGPMVSQQTHSLQETLAALSSSMQQFSDQTVAPLVANQQQVWQDSVATMSSHLQEWSVQSANQLDVVQKEVSDQSAAWQGTATEVGNRVAVVASEKTTVLQAAGQSLLREVQSVSAKVASQAQVQYAVLEEMTKNTAADVTAIGNQAKEEGSRLLAQYGDVASQKFHDWEIVASSEMRRLEQVATQVQADGNRLLSECGNDASKRYAEFEMVAEAKSDVMMAALNAWKQDATVALTQYGDVAAENYRDLEQVSLVQLGKLQDQLALLAQQMQSQAAQVNSQGQAYFAAKWVEVQPMLDANMQQMQSSLADDSKQSQDALANAKRQSIVFEAQTQDFLRQQVAEAQRIGRDQLDDVKSLYTQNAGTAQSMVSGWLQTSSIKAREAASNLVLTIQEVQRLIMQTTGSSKNALAASTSQIQDQVRSLTGNAATASQALKHESASLLSIMLFKAAKSSVASVEVDALKDTLQSMLD